MKDLMRLGFLSQVGAGVSSEGGGGGGDDGVHDDGEYDSDGDAIEVEMFGCVHNVIQWS